MQRCFWFGNACLQVLGFDDFKTLCSLDASQDHCLVYTSRYRNITIDAFLAVQAKGIGFAPKLLVVERFEPFIDFLAVFKFVHGFSVSNFRHQSQEISSKGYTRCL